MYKSSCLAAFALLILPLGALAEETTVRRFPLPDHGTLIVAAPASWGDRVSQPPGRLPPTLKFSPKTGRPFKVLVTPLWGSAGRTLSLDSAGIRKEVEDTAAEAQSSAVEKVLEVKALKGAGGAGWYFSATDRAPKPGEFKFMTQGIVPAGDLQIAFTILTNDGQSAAIKVALRLVQGIVQKKAGAAD
jgi:hypothetical protein